MMRYIRGFLIKKVPIFMVKEQDNRDLKGQKSPEYQGKTAIKEFQYGLKAARRAPQFSKRQSEHTFDYSAKRFKTTQTLYIWALGGFFYFCELL